MGTWGATFSVMRASRIFAYGIERMLAQAIPIPTIEPSKKRGAPIDEIEIKPRAPHRSR